MIFTKSGEISYTWLYNENPIEIVNIFCYLGIVFSYTGSFSETQSVLAQQGRKALFCLKSKIKQFLNIDPVMKCDLFDKLVLPVLMYGCEVWVFYPDKTIDQVHKDLCKTVLKVKGIAMNEMIYGELGRVPLIVLRLCRIITYWLRIIK